MIGEFEEKQRNFCQQLKKGQNIWEAVESSAGNAIVTAAKNLKVNPQTYEEGLRKLEKMQSLSHENQTEIGTFVQHCIATLKIFQLFIKTERFTLAASFSDFRRTKKAFRLRRRRRDNEKIGVYAALALVSLGLGSSLSYFLSVNQRFKAANGISGALNSREEWTLFFIIFSFIVCVGSIWRAFKLWRSDRYY
ncbi:hypothetical protein niasHT_032110 [Heterodera trifolii]|uniref:Uncharacterized protein n=1 Tax=Heterodera trifolii TaxID=157864 RepID=A0ABD2HP87_9BILA